MTRIAFCVALYEAHRACLPAFMAGVRAAARGHDACLVGAVDDLIDARCALGELASDLPVELTAAPAGASPAAVRRTMLQQAAWSGADVLIFADMDDMLLANAPGNHLAALEQADFSYGDMCLIDAEGQDQRRRFFDAAGVPWTVDSPGAVLRRNFLGLTNTAVRADRLTAAALQVPDDIVAVDWWLFTTLLLAGRRGARTTAPVTRYRLHDANTLGAGAPVSPRELLRSLSIMRRHYRAFPAVPAIAAQAARIDELIDGVESAAPGHIAARLASLRERPGVWFDGLDAIEPGVDTSTASVG